MDMIWSTELMTKANSTNVSLVQCVEQLTELCSNVSNCPGSFKRTSDKWGSLNS